MSLLTLTLADFQAALPFSKQIEEAQIRPFVDLAYTLDVVPLLDFSVLEAANALPAPTVLDYTDPTAVAANDLRRRRERIYRALASTTGATVPVLPAAGAYVAPDPALWQYEPLLTLWLDYLKPWWLRQSFARFLAQHGLNITKAGITVPTDRERGTYERPASADRAALLAEVESTAEALKSRLTAFLTAENTRFGTVPSQGYAYYPSGNCARPARRHARRFRGV